MYPLGHIFITLDPKNSNLLGEPPYYFILTRDILTANIYRPKRILARFEIGNPHLIRLSDCEIVRLSLDKLRWIALPESFRMVYSFPQSDPLGKSYGWNTGNFDQILGGSRLPIRLKNFPAGRSRP